MIDDFGENETLSLKNKPNGNFPLIESDITLAIFGAIWISFRLFDNVYLMKFLVKSVFEPNTNRQNLTKQYVQQENSGVTLSIQQHILLFIYCIIPMKTFFFFDYFKLLKFVSKQIYVYRNILYHAYTNTTTKWWIKK